MYRVLLVVSSILMLTLGTSAEASIAVPDSIGVVGRPLMLQAMTKRFFLPQGGLLVDFYIGDRFLGRRLSGGDGLARVEYTPTRRGLFWIRAGTGDDKAKGLLLVVGRSDPLLLIETETVIASSLIGKERTVKAEETLKRLSRRFRIIYISTTPLAEVFRREMLEDKFPLSVVLGWEGGYLLEELKEKGLKLQVYVGTGPNCDLAKGYVKEAISFTEADECLQVEGWEEVEKVLLKRR